MGQMPSKDLDTGELHAVDWVRAVRDAMYEETRNLSGAEFAEYVARKAAAVHINEKAVTLPHGSA